MIKPITFTEMVTLDNEVMAIAVNNAIRRAAIDCDDRPGCKTARKINVQLEIIPVLDQDGMCESVKYGFQVKETLPTRASTEYRFGLRKNGVLTFNPDALDSHDQHTFDFEKDKEQ